MPARDPRIAQGILTFSPYRGIDFVVTASHLPVGEAIGMSNGDDLDTQLTGIIDSTNQGAQTRDFNPHQFPVQHVIGNLHVFRPFA